MIKSLDNIFVQTSYPDIRKYLFYLSGIDTFFTSDTTFQTFAGNPGADTARVPSRLERRDVDRSNFRFF